MRTLYFVTFERLGRNHNVPDAFLNGFMVGIGVVADYGPNELPDDPSRPRRRNQESADA